ncbi:MAG: transposase [Chloroflexi bacterium]|nr:transposase [Chloroflexota bacterium]
MKYPKSIRLPASTYADRAVTTHVTIRAHPEISRFPDGLMDAIWATLLEQRSAGRVELLAACLMPDHVHLVLRPLEMDLLKFLNVWKSWTTRLAWTNGFRGGLWQPGMWDRSIRDGDDAEATMAYVLRNPVAAGLCPDERDWKRSWAWSWESEPLTS